MIVYAPKPQPEGESLRMPQPEGGKFRVPQPADDSSCASEDLEKKIRYAAPVARS